MNQNLMECKINLKMSMIIPGQIVLGNKEFSSSSSKRKKKYFRFENAGEVLSYLKGNRI